MGCTFDQTRKRWKNIEIGEEIIVLIEEMKNEDFNKRPSIDKTLEVLVLYCDEKKYSHSIDIIPFFERKQNIHSNTFQ